MARCSHPRQRVLDAHPELHHHHPSGLVDLRPEERTVHTPPILIPIIGPRCADPAVQIQHRECRSVSQSYRAGALRPVQAPGHPAVQDQHTQLGRADQQRKHEHRVDTRFECRGSERRPPRRRHPVGVGEITHQDRLTIAQRVHARTLSKTEMQILHQRDHRITGIHRCPMPTRSHHRHRRPRNRHRPHTRRTDPGNQPH
jgi:hypothetical protein